MYNEKKGREKQLRLKGEVSLPSEVSMGRRGFFDVLISDGKKEEREKERKKDYLWLLRLLSHQGERVVSYTSRKLIPLKLEGDGSERVLQNAAHCKLLQKHRDKEIHGNILCLPVSLDCARFTEKKVFQSIAM